MLGNKDLKKEVGELEKTHYPAFLKSVLMEIWKARHIQVPERKHESKVAEKFLEICTSAWLPLLKSSVKHMLEGLGLLLVSGSSSQKVELNMGRGKQ